MELLNAQKNTVVPNGFLQDERISLKSKGLLAVMLSLPKGADCNITNLCNLSSDGITAVRSALSELEDMGYLVRKRIKHPNGQFDYIYQIYV